ncbi:MAG: diadenylate cyclase CdaA [Candidatus Promineifilaceae bacterium]|nr:diadenylate cyclase CdaA [Candidatus Promineifilaceae bacterium]
MFDINSAVTSFRFLLATLEPVDYLDILLVTAAIYLLFSLIRRSQAAFLLRGIIAVVVLLLLANLLLPLPTFGSILFYAFLAILIVVPITLQPELRRWLEGFGRRFGFALNNRLSVAEEVIPPVTRTAENLSGSKTGALIVLEGNVPLSDVIPSGVPVNGRVTSELLQTIFFDKTPLHDGAAVIRNDRVLAAGCVLPLTERELRGPYRIGTRHRAAIGMSEMSDALCVVVSEETGQISVATDGRLERNLDRTSLHQRLSEFYAETAEVPSVSRWRPWANWQFKMPTGRQLLTNLGYLLLSFLLALVATMAVRQQNNPLVSTTMNGVTLRVVDLPEETTLLTPLPNTVAVDFQTPASILPSLGPASFQAIVSLAQVQEGESRAPVEAQTTADNVLVLGASPAEVDVSIAPIISRTISVTVAVQDRDQLSSAYEVRGGTRIEPSEEVLVTGPQPLVEEVTLVGTEISVAGATTTVIENLPLTAFNNDGEIISDVTIDPQIVQVSVFVRRRLNAKDVGVNVVTVGSPPEEYWLSGLTVIPASVTIEGDPSTIVEAPSFVNTLDVDLSEAIGDLVVDVPLDLPEGIQALDSSGNPLGTVEVTAQISPRSSDRLTGRPVELINDRGTFAVTMEPEAVQLLLSGPLATLNEIELSPEMVRVVIDALELEPNTSAEIVPEVITPEGVRARLIESSVLVTTGNPETQ